MKSSRVFSFIFLAALAAAAQTGTNAVATRAMSLPDCIQEALEHNFDVQIERYNPQISLYNLHAAYGGYDPTFNISGPAQLQCIAGPFQFEYRQPNSGHGVRSEHFQFRPHAARCRWGLQYNFSGNISEAIWRPSRTSV